MLITTAAEINSNDRVSSFVIATIHERAEARKPSAKWPSRYVPAFITAVSLARNAGGISIERRSPPAGLARRRRRRDDEVERRIAHGADPHDHVELVVRSQRRQEHEAQCFQRQVDPERARARNVRATEHFGKEQVHGGYRIVRETHRVNDACRVAIAEPDAPPDGKRLGGGDLFRALHHATVRPERS
jgi:hypothetical protein